MLINILVLLAAAVIGLGIFGAILLRDPDQDGIHLAPIVLIVLGIAGFAMARLIPVDAAASPGRALLTVGLLWTGWLGVVGIMIQALRGKMPLYAGWLIAGGALLTLAPLGGYIVAGWLT